MKKSLLGSALIAALASSGLAAGTPERAMHLSRDGLGQVLVFPYYTVNSSGFGAQQTLVSIVNTTDRAKAARLFFYEGRNGRPVATVTLYLMPFDTWTAAVFPLSDTGPANITTFDLSCTDPDLRQSNTLPELANGNHYLPFSNASYTGTQNDSGPDDLARTREGHLVLIELGEIVAGGNETLAAITPDETGAPAACVQVANAWSPNGYWTNNRIADLEPPGGGLSGSAYPINALNGTMQLIEADAIANFYDRVLNESPALGGPTLSTPTDAGPIPSAASVELIMDGVPTTLNYVGIFPVDAVSALFMAESIYNDFVATESLGGASEWVVTFPTKRYYVTGSETGIQAVEPFTNAFPIEGDRGTAPVGFGVEAWTRDGLPLDCIPPYSYSGCIIGVPPPSEPMQLNFVTNVISINQNERGLPQSAILGATQSFPIDFFDIFDGGTVPEGGMTIRFADSSAGTGPRLLPDQSGRRLYGMPVQAFWVASYTNTAVVPGVLANYSEAVKHAVRQTATPGTAQPAAVSAK